VTRALLAGIPEAVVRQWVGHLDREVTKIYTHILSPDSQAAMRRLNDLQQPVVNGQETPSNQKTLPGTETVFSTLSAQSLEVKS
jgi:hypothetical protein